MTWVGPHLTEQMQKPGLPLAGSGTPECSPRVAASPVPGWAQMRDGVHPVLGCISLCSGCLPAGFCWLHYPEEPQEFFWGQLYASGQQEMLPTECSMRLEPLDWSWEKRAVLEGR